MVQDDNTRRAQTIRISPDDEPIEVVPPRDDYTHDLILNTAQNNPQWDRFDIFECLVNSGYDVVEQEINWVLVMHNLRNLFVR